MKTIHHPHPLQSAREVADFLKDHSFVKFEDCTREDALYHRNVLRHAMYDLEHIIELKSHNRADWRPESRLMEQFVRPQMLGYYQKFFQDKTAGGAYPPGFLDAVNGYMEEDRQKQAKREAFKQNVKNAVKKVFG